jgi:hypothetical protein
MHHDQTRSPVMRRAHGFHPAESGCPIVGGGLAQFVLAFARGFDYMRRIFMPEA